MAERIERYLETAGAQVRWKRVRPALKRELRTHLEEQTEAYLAEGMAEDAAEAEAVRQMGDAEAVGLALDAVHRPKKQTAILLFAGLAIVLGMYLRAELIGSSYAFTLAAGLLACGALIGGYYLDYRCLSRYAWYIYGAVLVLGAVCVYQTTFMGPGAPCMLGITVGDTSEYAALLYPAAYALVVYALRGKKGGFWLSLAALTPFATLLLLDRYGKLMYRIVFAAGAAAVLLSAIRVELFRVKKNWARALVWTLLVLAIAGLLYMDSQQYHNFSNWYLSPAGLREWRAIMQEYHRNSSTVSALLERGELAEANRLGRLVGTPAWVWLAMLYAPQAVLLVILLVRTAKLQNPFGRMLCMPAGVVLSLRLVLGLLYQAGIFPLFMPLPFISGNLYTVMDAALLGLALSTLRQSACPERRTRIRTTTNNRLELDCGNSQMTVAAVL